MFDGLSNREFQQFLGMVERLFDSSDRAVALQRYLAEVNVKPVPLRTATMPARKPRKA